jgi:tRNA(adenine34) deaminase
MQISEFDVNCFQKAIGLALIAEEQKNLPIGAVISLEGKIIAEGKNAIWFPYFNQNRHAEIEALRNVPKELWEHAGDMTLYTTLEPCLMCMGAILLHGIGRVFFGSLDDFGGASIVAEYLPPYFEQQFSKIQWNGPAYPIKCDPLYARITALEGLRNLSDDSVA